MTDTQNPFSDLENIDQDDENDDTGDDHVEEPQPTEPDEPEPDTSEPETTTDNTDTEPDDEPTETMSTETTTPNTTTKPDTTTDEEERSWRETPAFPHNADIDHTTLYARTNVIDELDDLIFDVEYKLRREHDLSDITTREIHDALIRQADADDIAEQVREDREHS